MGRKHSEIVRLTWRQIASSQEFRGRWVALDNVRYEPSTSLPVEADVVDADEDLAELCGRMRTADRTSCAIVFCEDEGYVTPSVRLPSRFPPRAAQH